MQVKELNSGYHLVQLSKLSQSSKTPIPNTWEVKKLKDIAEINPGVIDVNYSKDKILYIDIGSIAHFEIQKYEHFDLNKRPSRAQRIVKKNDIIVSTVRPYLKAFTKISDSKPNLICSTGFAVVRPRNSDDADFIFNYIKSPIFDVNIIRHMEGMAYPAVTSKMVEDSLIPYPTNRNERFKIGSIFLNLNDLIKKTDLVIEQTQRLKKGLMERLLTKGIGHTKFKEIHLQFWFQKYSIPQEWKTVALGEIVKLQTGYPFKSENFSESGIRLLKGSNVLVQKIDWQEVDYYPESEVTNVADYLLREGDIVIAMDRPFISDGFKIARTSKKDLPCLLVQRIGRFIRSSNIDYEYLYYFLHSEFYLKNLLILQKGMDLPHISNSEILSPLIPLPDLIEQKKITSILSSIDDQISKEQQHRSFLIDMKNGLLQILLTGKIRVKV